MTNVVLAVVWLAAGALVVGAAIAAGRSRAGRSARVVASLLSLGILLAVSIWLVLPVTAFGRTIDTSEPTAIECGSAWGSLGGSSWIYTDAGRVYALGSGECQAAAWRRVAASGSAEVALAAVIGIAAAFRRRRSESAGREPHQAVGV